MGIFDRVLGYWGAGKGADTGETARAPDVQPEAAAPDADDFYGSNRPENGYRPVMADWIEHRPSVVERTAGDAAAFGREYRQFFGVEQTAKPTLEQVAEIAVDIASAWPNHVMDGFRHGAVTLSEGTIAAMEKSMDAAGAPVPAYDRSQFMMQRAILDIAWNNPEAADAWRANSYRAVQAAGVLSGNPEVSDVPEQLHDDMLAAVDRRWAQINRQGSEKIDLDGFARILDQDDWNAHLAARPEGKPLTEEERSLFFIKPEIATNPSLEHVAETVAAALSSQPPQMDGLRYGDLLVTRETGERITKRVRMSDMAIDGDNARYRYAMTEVVGDLRKRLPEFDATMRERADETTSHHLPALRQVGLTTSDPKRLQDAIIDRAAQTVLHFTIQAGGMPAGMDGFEDPAEIASAASGPSPGKRATIDVATGREEDGHDRPEVKAKDANMIGAMISASRQAGR